MAEENGSIGENTALSKEIVVLETKNLRIYVNTNMEVRVELIIK